MKQKTLDYQKWATQYQTEAEERKNNAKLNAATGDEGTEEATYDQLTPALDIFENEGAEAADRYPDAQPEAVRGQIRKYVEDHKKNKEGDNSIPSGFVGQVSDRVFGNSIA